MTQVKRKTATNNTDLSELEHTEHVYINNHHKVLKTCRSNFNLGTMPMTFNHKLLLSY